MHLRKKNKNKQNPKNEKHKNSSLTYIAIADELNRLRYKTETGKKWAAITVKLTIDFNTC